MLTCKSYLKFAFMHCVFNCRGDIPTGDDIIKQEDIVKLKRCIYSAHRSSLPPVCTHNVVNDQEDPCLNTIRRCQLFNNRHDRVKVSRVKPVSN